MARKKRSDRNHAVYQIVCRPTGERYIGLTVVRGRAFQKSVKIRWDGHVHHAIVEGNRHASPRTQRRVYGQEEESVNFFQPNSLQVMKTNIPENLTTGDIILATGMFTSKSEATKAVKNRGLKINGETVDEMNEKIEHGDFLNLAFAHPSIARECVARNSLDTLVVRFGKNRFAIVRVNGSVSVDTVE